MAITPGTVVVDDDGNIEQADDPAGRLFTLLHAQAVTDLAAVPLPPGMPAPSMSGPEAAPALKAIAKSANLYAAWLCGEFDRIRAAVTTSDAGIQRMPASTAEDTETKAPAAKKLLTLEYAP
jgi:hypothetical protein